MGKGIDMHTCSQLYSAREHALYTAAHGSEVLKQASGFAYLLAL